MDEKPDEIIGQIQARRDELGRNLNELEDKVRRTADWHTHFDKNPMLILGAALGGGILVGSMVGGRRSKSSTRGIKPWKGTASSSSGISGKSAMPSASSFYTPSSSPSYTEPTSSSSSVSGAASKLSGQMHQVGEALDHIKGALIAFGISKTKEFLSQAVPGLENHLGEIGKSHSASSEKKQHDPQSRPYSTGSSATTNTGRTSEADEYAGVGSGIHQTL